MSTNFAQVDWNTSPLADCKAFKSFILSNECTAAIDAKYPPYKQVNAANGIYDAATTAEIRAWVVACRDAFYAAKAQVDAAQSNDAVYGVQYEVPAP